MAELIIIDEAMVPEAEDKLIDPEGFLLKQKIINVNRERLRAWSDIKVAGLPLPIIHRDFQFIIGPPSATKSNVCNATTLPKSERVEEIPNPILKVSLVEVNRIHDAIVYDVIGDDDCKPDVVVNNEST